MAHHVEGVHRVPRREVRDMMDDVSCRRVASDSYAEHVSNSVGGQWVREGREGLASTVSWARRKVKTDFGVFLAEMQEGIRRYGGASLSLAGLMDGGLSVLCGEH